MIFFNEKKLERFESFLTQKIDFESHNFAHFEDFYSTDHKTEIFFDELVVDFGPKGRPDKMCNSVR